jgi:hypothetical protein
VAVKIALWRFDRPMHEVKCPLVGTTGSSNTRVITPHSTAAKRVSCADNRAGSGNRLRAANRRGRNIDQA